MSTAIRPHVWKQRDRRWAVRVADNDPTKAVASLRTALFARDLLAPDDALDIEAHTPFSEEDGYVWRTLDRFPRRNRRGIKDRSESPEIGDHIRAIHNDRSAHGFLRGTVCRVTRTDVSGTYGGGRIYARGLSGHSTEVLIENFLYPGEWEYTDEPLTQRQAWLDEGFDYPGEF